MPILVTQVENFTLSFLKMALLFSNQTLLHKKIQNKSWWLICLKIKVLVSAIQLMLKKYNLKSSEIK
jgi:hypothetical protein